MSRDSSNTAPQDHPEDNEQQANIRQQIREYRAQPWKLGEMVNGLEVVTIRGAEHLSQADQILDIYRIACEEKVQTQGIIASLRRNNFDFSATDSKGNTIAHYAVLNRDQASYPNLFVNTELGTQANNDGVTPLDIAQANRDNYTVRYIKSELNIQDKRSLAEKIGEFAKETNPIKKLSMSYDIEVTTRQMQERKTPIRARDVKKLAESVAKACNDPNLSEDQKKKLAYSLAKTFSDYEKQHNQTPGKLNHLFKTSFLKKVATIFSGKDSVGKGLDKILDQNPELVKHLQDAFRSSSTSQASKIGVIQQRIQEKPTGRL